LLRSGFPFHQRLWRSLPSRGSSARGAAELRRLVYLVAAVLVEIGIFSIRWNVVVGGQLFSKSLRGLTVYKMELLGQEGLAIGVALLALPFFILWGLVALLPPWEHVPAATAPGAGVPAGTS